MWWKPGGAIWDDRPSHATGENHPPTKYQLCYKHQSVQVFCFSFAQQLQINYNIQTEAIPAGAGGISAGSAYFDY
jgi:hypothetical protein